MILYLDSSALVKRYVSERGTPEVAQAIADAELVGTAEVSRAEISAALSKAVRVGILDRRSARQARRLFHADWPSFVRTQFTEAVAARADDLAWQLGLRGYDAVHLASATTWSEGMQAKVVVATFDLQLWEAARKRHFVVFPETLSAFLEMRS